MPFGASFPDFLPRAEEAEEAAVEEEELLLGCI